MRNLRKALAAGTASIALLAAFGASVGPAQAGDGAAIAAGAIGGLAAGAILGDALAGGGYGYYGAPAYSYGYAAPAYSYGYAPAYYRTCYRHRQPVYDDWGDFVGYRLVRTCS